MLITMGLQCFPIPVLGSNFSAQLKKRDQFIKKANMKVNQSLNKQLDWSIEKLNSSLQK